MPGKWQGLINSLLIAWALRTSFILHLALKHRTRESNQLGQRKEDFLTSPSHPLISIIIPAFNEEASIANTLLSCVGANYLNREIIVIDDGSIDNTREVAKAIGDNEPDQRIRVLSSTQNQGKAEAINLGLNHAAGEIIVTLDADTRFANSKTLTALITPLISDPRIAASTANLKIANTSETLGQLQDIEYAKIIQTTKRAQSETNSILILPGAISAFRKKPL